LFPHADGYFTDITSEQLIQHRKTAK